MSKRDKIPKGWTNTRRTELWRLEVIKLPIVIWCPLLKDFAQDPTLPFWALSIKGPTTLVIWRVQKYLEKY